ncbi:MAG: zf-HC2 domain-containing protein [Chloroflexi bacterium]|nr:zf-HC2 domain-containing protein [Chloroflexota bacterium]
MTRKQPCQETIERLQTFLDRELNETEIRTVHCHLDRCPPCAHLFRFEERLRRLVKVHGSAECAPEAFRSQILALIKQRSAAKARQRTP